MHRFRMAGPSEPLAAGADTVPEVTREAPTDTGRGEAEAWRWSIDAWATAGSRSACLSFGSWVTFANQVDTDLAAECLTAARDAGVNFFDNAETYAGG